MAHTRGVDTNDMFHSSVSITTTSGEASPTGLREHSASQPSRQAATSPTAALLMTQSAFPAASPGWPRFLHCCCPSSPARFLRPGCAGTGRSPPLPSVKPAQFPHFHTLPPASEPSVPQRPQHWHWPHTIAAPPAPRNCPCRLHSAGVSYPLSQVGMGLLPCPAQLAGAAPRHPPLPETSRSDRPPSIPQQSHCSPAEQTCSALMPSAPTSSP
mmetsp:Transcript_1346/g.2624  ORF Transcript_1346/g.2624 Transcript_1346/m.2624 type:complete len:213 (-) Transcript_1346:422-1060(-)